VGRPYLKKFTRRDVFVKQASTKNICLVSLKKLTKTNTKYKKLMIIQPKTQQKKIKLKVPIKQLNNK
jgi:hypothetical protein